MKPYIREQFGKEKEGEKKTPQETVEKIFGILKGEDFGNDGQRGKMISLIARLKSADTPEARKFFKDLGSYCTDYFKPEDKDKEKKEEEIQVFVDRAEKLVEEVDGSIFRNLERKRYSKNEMYGMSGRGAMKSNNYEPMIVPVTDDLEADAYAPVETQGYPKDYQAGPMNGYEMDYEDDDDDYDDDDFYESKKKTPIGDKKVLKGKNSPRKGIKEGFQPKDELLQGFDYQELMDTVYSNEEVIDVEAVMRTFDDMVNMNVRDARNEIKRYARLVVKVLD